MMSQVENASDSDRAESVELNQLRADFAEIVFRLEKLHNDELPSKNEPSHAFKKGMSAHAESELQRMTLENEKLQFQRKLSESETKKELSKNSLLRLQSLASVFGAIAAVYYLVEAVSMFHLPFAVLNLAAFSAAFFCLGTGGAYLAFSIYRERQATSLREAYGDIEARADALAARIVTTDDNLHGA